MPGGSDHEDRNEALRLFVGLVAALATLILVLVAGGYFLFGWFAGASESFDDGLGLRRAAVIAAVVSFLVAIVFAAVSGGFAIVGELPFVIAGFFVFFLFFWLMIAWVF